MLEAMSTNHAQGDVEESQVRSLRRTMRAGYEAGRSRATADLASWARALRVAIQGAGVDVMR